VPSAFNLVGSTLISTYHHADASKDTECNDACSTTSSTYYKHKHKPKDLYRSVHYVFAASAMSWSKVNKVLHFVPSGSTFITS
jgi:hypothetical protein